MLDRYQQPALRYRRFGGGYRREDVDFALTELRLTLHHLDNDLTTLRNRNGEIEGELTAARTALESFRTKEHELAQAMTYALRRATEIEEEANARAQEIIANAKQQAMQIRSEATRRIEESSTQFDELVRLKDNLLHAMRGVVADFDHAISTVERGEQLFPESGEKAAEKAAESIPAKPDPEPAAKHPPLAPAPAPAPPLAPSGPEAVPPGSPVPPAAAAPPAGSAPRIAGLRAPEPAPPQSEGQLFERSVELDAGPFPDFVALSAFERSLARLSTVEDVYVHRLADSRALIELTLTERAPLVQAMRDFLPYSLDVRDADGSHLVVDVGSQSAAGQR